jgi:hypothetical protein
MPLRLQRPVPRSPVRLPAAGGCRQACSKYASGFSEDPNSIAFGGCETSWPGFRVVLRDVRATELNTRVPKNHERSLKRSRLKRQGLALFLRVCATWRYVFKACSRFSYRLARKRRVRSQGVWEQVLRASSLAAFEACAPAFGFALDQAPWVPLARGSRGSLLFGWRLQFDFDPSGFSLIKCFVGFDHGGNRLPLRQDFSRAEAAIANQFD